MRPTQTNILIDIIKADTVSKSGLIITPKDDVRTETAKVVAVGPQVEGITEGDTVVFKAYSLFSVEVGDKEYSFIKEEDVLALS